MSDPAVTRIADGVYRVETDGRAEVVYVAGPRGEQWAHWNGHTYHRPFDEPASTRRSGVDGPVALSAPMPATVLKVLVAPGATVRRGDTLVILEAMKMELPVHAATNGTVRTVSCREGDLVQAGAILIEVE